jgi:hypothetical protein
MLIFRICLCISLGNIAQNSQNNWETLPTASTWESATENNNQEYGNQNGNQEQSHNEELRDYSSEGQEVVDEFETVDTDEDGSAAWGSQDNFDEAWGDSVDWGTAQNIESPEQEVNKTMVKTNFIIAVIKFSLKIC